MHKIQHHPPSLKLQEQHCVKRKEIVFASMKSNSFVPPSARYTRPIHMEWVEKHNILG